MVEIDFLAANHVRIVGLCGQNWKWTLCYSFSLRCLIAYVPKMLLSIWLHMCTTRPQGMGLACRGHWALGSAQFTVYSLRRSLITQVSNCQDGCQTNSRRYDDLLSTNRLRRPLKYVLRDCTCDGLRVRIKCMGLYGRPPLALAGLLVTFDVRAYYRNCCIGCNQILHSD